MTVMPKQLIIDKVVFEGTNTNKLCAFAENHFLILPDVLLYECLTTPKKNNILSHRFEQVMLAGAYVCPPIKTILYKEAHNLSPYGFLPDLKMTTYIRKTIKKNNTFFNSTYIQNMYEKHCKSAQILLDSAPKTAEKITAQEPKVLREAKQYQANRSERFKLWVETVMCEDIHKLVIQKLGHLADSPEKFCLSDEWITWYYFCFVSVIYLEYSFLRTVQDETPKLIKAEHDCQDIEYASYLSRVDGLLTKDKQLVTPVAKAAFPDKDVFSSLDEVPDEYLCHWS